MHEVNHVNTDCCLDYLIFFFKVASTASVIVQQSCIVSSGKAARPGNCGGSTTLRTRRENRRKTFGLKPSVQGRTPVAAEELT